MKISMIVAANEQRVIGKDNQLPWHIPEDLKRFKALTWGFPILMGRKTFESIGRPLPGRANLVLSRDASFAHDGVHVFPNMNAALEHARLELKASRVFIIGGASLYQEGMALAHDILMTLVDKQVDGDVFFPEIPDDLLILSNEDWNISTGPEGLRYSYRTYARGGSNPAKGEL